MLLYRIIHNDIITYIIYNDIICGLMKIHLSMILIFAGVLGFRSTGICHNLRIEPVRSGGPVPLDKNILVQALVFRRTSQFSCLMNDSRLV